LETELISLLQNRTLKRVLVLTYSYKNAGIQLKWRYHKIMKNTVIIITHKIRSIFLNSQATRLRFVILALIGNKLQELRFSQQLDKAVI